MAIARRTDILYAQKMYGARLRELRDQVEKLVACAVLDASYEEEAMSILKELEREIDGIGDCIAVLEHLSKQIEGV